MTACDTSIPHFELQLVLSLKESTGWCFQICFIFTPIFGEMIQFDEQMFQLGGTSQGFLSEAFGFTHCFGELKRSDWATCSLLVVYGERLPKGSAF